MKTAGKSGSNWSSRQEKAEIHEHKNVLFL